MLVLCAFSCVSGGLQLGLVLVAFVDMSIRVDVFQKMRPTSRELFCLPPINREYAPLAVSTDVWPRHEHLGDALFA